MRSMAVGAIAEGRTARQRRPRARPPRPWAPPGLGGSDTGLGYLSVIRNTVGHNLWFGKKLPLRPSASDHAEAFGVEAKRPSTELKFGSAPTGIAGGNSPSRPNTSPPASGGNRSSPPKQASIEAPAERRNTRQANRHAPDFRASFGICPGDQERPKKFPARLPAPAAQNGRGGDRPDAAEAVAADESMSVVGAGLTPHG